MSLSPRLLQHVPVLPTQTYSRQVLCLPDVLQVSHYICCSWFKPEERLAHGLPGTELRNLIHTPTAHPSPIIHHPSLPKEGSRWKKSVQEGIFDACCWKSHGSWLHGNIMVLAEEDLQLNSNHTRAALSCITYVH